MAVNTGSGAPVAPDGSGGMGSLPNTQPPTQPRMEQPISKNKSPLPKLNIKGGDPTTLTRVINEWIQKTAIALNTWSIEASNFWNQSVNSARQQHNWWLSLAPQDRATHIGLPTSFQALPTQVPVLEATMRAELINSVLPEKVTSIAMQKGALKVHELLFLTFQAFLPSEPSARVDGLNTVETPLKAARNFAEALTTLRTWRQQVVTVVTDLKANPEPLKLFNSLKILISNLTSSDNAFATEVSQMYRSTPRSRRLALTRLYWSSWDCWRLRCLTEPWKMMRIEEEEDKPTWLPHHLNLLLMPQMLQQMLLAKEGGKEKESPRMEEKERRGQCVRSILQTKDVQKVTNVLTLTPGRLENVSDVVLQVMT